MSEIIHISWARFEDPTETSECPEAMESLGRTCRNCPKKGCYRNGWLKPAVDADNKKIVAKRREVQ